MPRFRNLQELGTERLYKNQNSSNTRDAANEQRETPRYAPTLLNHLMLRAFTMQRVDTKYTVKAVCGMLEYEMGDDLSACVYLLVVKADYLVSL